MKRVGTLLLPALLALVVGLSGCLAPTTTLYVDPPSVRDPTLVSGHVFTVNISIADVKDLYAFQFELKWNGPVLNVTKITEGPFLKQAAKLFSSIKFLMNLILWEKAII